MRKVKDPIAYYHRLLSRLTPSTEAETLARIRGKNVSEFPYVVLALAYITKGRDGKGVKK